LLRRLLGRPDNTLGMPRGTENVEQDSVSPSLPSDRRLYCIGDIHGRLDLLKELHAMIVADAAGFDGSKIVVYLGDYIDRGAESCQVLDLLVEQPLSGFEAIYLLGNHEQSMLDFLEEPLAAAAWLTYGGRVCLLSYGVGLGTLVTMQTIEVLRDELLEKLPKSHLDFLESCQLSYSEGDYYFVHAGIRPSVPLSEQEPADQLWIREEFINSQIPHECVIVHGHTISAEVQQFSNRIGIDTGAYATGLLTALVLEGQEQRLLQTGRA
jgi:serine/threonine protein phosphatase 1